VMPFLSAADVQKLISNIDFIPGYFFTTACIPGVETAAASKEDCAILFV
jgi:hypothetical protein